MVIRRKAAHEKRLQTVSDGPGDIFEPTLEVLLAPIAKLMIQHGTTISTATEKLKHALVLAAEADQGQVTDSKISLQTGLHRKDVKRLREAGPSSPLKSKLSAAALTMTRWQSDSDFCDPNGKPRPLMREDGPDGPGFDSLIKRTKVDTAPATMLNQLIENAVVTETVDGRYVLLPAAVLQGGADMAAALQAFQATVGLHLEVGTHNILPNRQTPRYFDRVLRYTHLSPESAATLERTTKEQVGALLAEINALAFAYQQEDADKGGQAKSTFAFGAYIAPQVPDKKLLEDQG